MINCAYCGEPLSKGHSATALIVSEGVCKFAWTCEYHQIGDAVCFVSDMCAKLWLLEHAPDLLQKYEEFVQTSDCCGLNPFDVIQ